MKKTDLLKVINIILALDFLIIAGTALSHDIIVETGFYRQFHAYPGYLLITLVAVHLFLNWNWVKATYLKKKSK